MFSFALPAAPAQARTLKNTVWRRRYCKFRLSAVFARNENREHPRKTFRKRRAENPSKNACRKPSIKTQKFARKPPKMPPKIDPGGLRRPPASQLGAWSLPERPKTQQPDAKRAPRASQERLSQKITSKNKPGYHGTGSARGERACKHCKQGESRKSCKNSESRSAKTTKKSKARVTRAPRRSRQQARRIAYALARPLRGLAGRLELGASRSHRFLELLSGALQKRVHFICLPRVGKPRNKR